MVAESGTFTNNSFNGCLTIGLEHQSNGKWYYFDGKIDDVAIWDRSLSSAELNQLYTGQVAPDYEGPNIFNVTVSPTTVDVTTSNQIITVSYQATDTTGVDTSYSYRPSLSFGNQYYNFPVNFSLVSGTLQNGTFASSTTLSSSTHPPGNYRLNNFRNRDLNNLYSDYTGSMSNAVTITNNSGADFVGPYIFNVKVTPSTVNNLSLIHI